MDSSGTLSGEELQALGRLDTCAVANAIERFEVRLRNTGFADSSIRCIFHDLGAVVGYAATARLRSAEPPVEGGTFQDRTDWWSSITAVPAPRIVVLEDRDAPPGRGAFLGDSHAAVLRALGCVAYVTNGAVRELPQLRAMRFPVFAGNVALSHAYSHIFELGAPVEIGGLTIETGDLLHGDQHGLQNVPLAIAADIPAVAARQRQRDDQVAALCRSPEFTVERLRALLRTLD